MPINSYCIHSVSVGAQQGVVLMSGHIQAANDAILCANSNGEPIWGQPQGCDWSLMLSLHLQSKQSLAAACRQNTRRKDQTHSSRWHGTS